MAEVVGRCGRRKQRNPRKKNDVLDEHKLSESAALATARVSTSDDEDGQSKKKSTTHTAHQTSPVADGHHGNQTKDGREGQDVPPEDIKVDDFRLAGRQERKRDEDDSLTVSSENLTVCKSREIIADNLDEDKTTGVIPESFSDHDEENQVQNEESIIEEEYLLKCLYCETTSTRSTVLRDHMRNQHPEKPIRYQCPKCEQTFLLKSHLDKHLAMHSPTSQSCKVCQKTFANVYRLQRHMISHSESTDLRKFKCPECGKAFKFKHHLKEHIRIHSGEKPFQCPTCNKRFSHSGSYSSHMTSKKCWVIGQSKGQGRRQERPSAETGRVRETSQCPGESGQLMFPVGQMYTQPLSSPPPGAYPQQFIKFDQHPSSLRHQFFSNPPITTAAIMTSAQNALALSLYHQKLASTSCTPSASASGVSLMPAHLHHQQNIPLHLLTHAIPDAHMSHRSAEEHMKKTPALVDALLSGPYKSDLRPSVSSQTAESISLPTPSPSPLRPQSSPSAERKAEGEVKYTKDLMKAMEQSKLQVKEELKTEAVTDVKEEVMSEGEELKMEDISDMIVGEVKLEMKAGGEGEICRYCQKQFTSPVDLHQHERYLCPDNHDIKKVISGNRTVLNTAMKDEEQDRVSPVSSKDSDDETEDMDDEEEDDEEDFKSNKLTESQVQHLRGCYRDNKKPDDHAIEEIAKIIGASKKMVQMWFQSARLRERRKLSGYKAKHHKVFSGRSQVSNCPSSYIPIVPNPFAIMGSRYQKLPSGQMSLTHISPLTPPSDDQPLDLSVRKQTPPKAHENHSVQLTNGDNFQDQVLNLSNKVCKEESCSTSTTPQPSLPAHFLHIPDPQGKHMNDLEGKPRFQSDIFKYMTQKGLFKGGFSSAMVESSAARKFSPSSLLNPTVLAQITGVIPPNNHHPQRESPVKTTTPPTGNKNTGISSLSSSPSKKLIIDESLDDGKTKSPGFERDLKKMIEGNLQTLANVASLEELRAAEGKRKRKKSSKQVESEEIKMDDLEDSVSNTDEDTASSPRKRRRSWKGHRISEELGMYACDQCDKQFSKQSSLARHKYEHSGARPFNCEVCSKAFKHKHHLTEHRRLHSGEKPFKCRKCGKRFSHSGSYSQHMNHRYKFCKPSDGEDEDVAAGSSKED